MNEYGSEYFASFKPLERNGSRYFSTPNYLSTTSFRVLIPRLPKMTYFVQTVSIPSVILGSLDVPAFKGLPKQEAPSFLDISDQIIINFTIDENMENWQEIYDWMNKIVPSNENNGSVNDKRERFSEIIVLVYNSAKTLKKKITFHDCFPVNLSSFEFNSASTEIDPIVVTTNFEYSHFSVETI